MRIGIAAEHGGFDMNHEIDGRLREAGHDVTDFGAHHVRHAHDFPHYVLLLAEAMALGTVVRGIAMCSSTVGASIGANKFSGLRNCFGHDNFSGPHIQR